MRIVIVKLPAAGYQIKGNKAEIFTSLIYVNISLIMTVC